MIITDIRVREVAIHFHDAEDLTQETFLEAFERLQRLRDPTRLRRLAPLDCDSPMYQFSEEKNHRIGGIEKRTCCFRRNRFTGVDRATGIYGMRFLRPYNS